MKIALYSDLHTEFIPREKLREFLQPMLEPFADVCVLAGDIAVGKHNVVKVLKIFADVYSCGFREVIYVPGNHEYYGSDIFELDNMHSLLPKNVHILNPGSVVIRTEYEAVQFIGASLWTNFNNDFAAKLAAKSMIADFGRIKGFTPEHSVFMNDRDTFYIQNMYEKIAHKKVIVTHFLPAVECISPRFRGPNLLNHYFANDMGDWISNLKDTTWMFGHTHDAVDFMLGDTRMICNPYGYNDVSVNPDFKFTGVFDV